MRLSCALIVVLGAAAASWDSFVENGSPANAIEHCTDYRVRYIYTHVDAKTRAAFPRDKTTAAIQAICRRASRRGFLSSEGMISAPEFATLVKGDIDVFKPACRLSFIAGLRLFARRHSEVSEYITGEVKKAYTGPCRFINTIDFSRPGFLDFRDLYRLGHHQEGLMPVCAASLLATYDKSWAPAEKAALPRIRFKKPRPARAAKRSARALTA